MSPTNQLPAASFFRSRRSLIFSGMASGLIALGYGGSRWGQNLPPRDPAAEQRYRRAQDTLLQANGGDFQQTYLQISDPNLRVHVLEAGKGDPVLLIHGGNGTAAQWVPLFGRLQLSFRVFAPDRPGCGLTQMCNYNETGVPLRQHAVAFVRSTMDALGLERATIIGNSMGGYFSLAFALAHPERVSRLITIGEPAGSSASVPFMFRLLAIRGVNRLMYSTIMKPGDASTRDFFARMLVSNVHRVSKAYLDCVTAGALIPGATESWLTMVQNAGPLTYALRPELEKLSVPTLLIWGDKDAFGSPGRGAEMAALMPRGRLEIVQDAGHLVWVDQPDKCTDLVCKFLNN